MDRRRSTGSTSVSERLDRSLGRSPRQAVLMRRDPIVISPYDPRWPRAFETERDRLEPVLRPWLVRSLEHIGSTSIPGIPAKGIIDMLAVVGNIDDLQQAESRLAALGWVHAPEPGDDERRVRSFCTPSIANRTHHLHVVEEASPGWRGTLAFRDYLRTHPGLAGAYAALKRELAAQHGGDPNKREAYRGGKAQFIAEVTAVALGQPATDPSRRRRPGTVKPDAEPPADATVVVAPQLTANQLFDFYERNNVCETGFGKEGASRILHHPHVIVAAFAERELVGLARATFDGLSAAIMEFSLDLRWQRTGTNSSLMQGDPFGLGQRLGRALLAELDRLGSTFITAYIVSGVEESFYESLGFKANRGHLAYYIDQRPYVSGS